MFCNFVLTVLRNNVFLYLVSWCHSISRHPCSCHSCSRHSCSDRTSAGDDSCSDTSSNTSSDYSTSTDDSARLRQGAPDLQPRSLQYLGARRQAGSHLDRNQKVISRRDVFTRDMEWNGYETGWNAYNEWNNSLFWLKPLFFLIFTPISNDWYVLHNPYVQY